MKKILIVEGNLKEENQQFTNAGIQTHTESLKDSIAYFTKNLEIDVANPSSDLKVFENIKNLEELKAYLGDLELAILSVISRHQYPIDTFGSKYTR